MFNRILIIFDSAKLEDKILYFPCFGTRITYLWITALTSTISAHPTARQHNGHPTAVNLHISPSHTHSRSKIMTSNSSPHPSVGNTSEMPHLRDLTLILATTPSMGIGRAGGLPWSQLKSDMAYFARVTKRVAPRASTSSAPASPRRNAVIMGRKTWESIPPRFRPLKERVNVVVSRNRDFLASTGEGVGKGEQREDVFVASGLGEALETLGKQIGKEGEEGEGGAAIGRVFVIGGAQVYAAALGMKETRRILLTRVRREYDCDTFFPVDLSSEETAEKAGWRKAGTEELEEYVGEKVDGEKRDGDVDLEFCLFVRE